MAGALGTYAFINAKLRARISKILSIEALQELARAHSVPECVQLLAQTDFAVVAEAYSSTGDIRTAELELFSQEIRLYVEIEKGLRGIERDFLKALATRFEIENITAALRLWFDAHIRGRGIEGAPGYLYRKPIHHEIDLDRIIHAATLEEASEALSHTPYGALVRKHAPEVERMASLFPIEVAFDHYYFRNLLDATAALSSRDRAIAERLIGVEIDLQNMGWLLRLSGFYDLPADQALQSIVPWGLNLPASALKEAYESGSGHSIVTDLIKSNYPQLAPLLSGSEHQSGNDLLVLLESILEEVLMVEVARAKGGYPFTIGVVLAYFLLKRNETRRIMTILNAKSYGWSEEMIAAVI
ncbi:MAG: V-type ATPase subunit [Planctomycetota bacterium]|jgi:V/A-type H+-transporting ATPase subunit C